MAISPQITVIIRFSRITTIHRALRSVLQQQWRDTGATTEILIVDALGNNPPIETLIENEWIELLGSPRERRWIPDLHCVTQHQSLKRAEALQFGIDQARGEFAVFLDDDDSFEPGHLEKLYRGFLERKTQCEQLIALTSGVRLIRQSDPENDTTVHEVGAWDRPPDSKLMQLLVTNFVPLNSFICRRSDLQRCKVDPEFEIYEDWDLVNQLFQIGKFCHLPGITANYFFHFSGSGAHSNEKLRSQMLDRIRKKWMKTTLCIDYDSKNKKIFRLIDQLRQNNDKFAEQLQQEHAKCSELGRSLHELSDKLISIEKSLSWRITSPLRALSRIIRALVNFLR